METMRRLLAALLVNAGSVVSADRLADVVWGDDPPESTTGALHNLVSRLRRRLRDTDAVELSTQAPGYTLTEGGETESQTEIFTQMIIALGVAAAVAGERPKPS